MKYVLSNLCFCWFEHVDGTQISLGINKVLSYLIFEPQPDTTNITSDLSSPETLSNSSLKFSHHLSGLLQSLLGFTSFQPLQLIQNAATRLDFNLPRPSPCYPLHTVIPLAACIEYKILLLANRAAMGSTQTHHQTSIQAFTHHSALLFCHHWPFSSPPPLVPYWLAVSLRLPYPPLQWNFDSSILGI